MIKLTATGWAHTLFSLISLLCGIFLLISRGEIAPDNRTGRLFLIATALSAITALMIFQRGGFGPGHILAILTLAAIGFGLLVGRGAARGSWRHVLAALAFSFTLLCQLVPGATETLTRFPLGNPLIARLDSPELRAIFLGLLVAYGLLALTQIVHLRRLHAGRITPALPPVPPQPCR